MREVTETEYDEFLDEVYEPFKMGQLTLKSCDPIAYREGKNDYEDSLEDESDEDEDPGQLVEFGTYALSQSICAMSY